MGPGRAIPLATAHRIRQSCDCDDTQYRARGRGCAPRHERYGQNRHTRVSVISSSGIPLPLSLIHHVYNAIFHMSYSTYSTLVVKIVINTPSICTRQNGKQNPNQASKRGRTGMHAYHRAATRLFQALLHRPPYSRLWSTLVGQQPAAMPMRDSDPSHHHPVVLLQKRPLSVSHRRRHMLGSGQ